MRLVVLPLLLMIPAVPAWSTTYTFATAPGAQTSNSGTNYAVDIQAILTLNTVTQTVVIQLLNLEDNPQTDLQMLGSIQITFSGLKSGVTTAPTVTASSFTAIDVTSSSSQPTVVTRTPATTWHSAQTPSSTANEIFCTDCPGGGSKQLLIGGPSSAGGVSGDYSNANGSITSPGHQPEVIASGQTYTGGNLAGVNTSPQWTLFVPELGSNSTITAVSFGFGTQWGASGSTVTAQLQTVPEPGAGSLVLLGVCLMGAGVSFKHRFQSSMATLRGHSTASRDDSHFRY
ncbi:MAG TPA: PEP-CTERM sorting domain-containing protein [Bryobacteraceae bacterium]|nr:PEP-CTERM sorting domain-containing protein [Bryobacteraceae bacterium]